VEGCYKKWANKHSGTILTAKREIHPIEKARLSTIPGTGFIDNRDLCYDSYRSYACLLFEGWKARRQGAGKRRRFDSDKV